MAKEFLKMKEEVTFYISLGCSKCQRFATAVRFRLNPYHEILVGCIQCKQSVTFLLPGMGSNYYVNFRSTAISVIVQALP